jgi:hypothetical protein
MSVWSHSLTSLDSLRASPLILSVMAYSFVMAFCLDVTDVLTARDPLELFPIQKP